MTFVTPAKSSGMSGFIRTCYLASQVSVWATPKRRVRTEDRKTAMMWITPGNSPFVPNLADYEVCVHNVRISAECRECTEYCEMHPIPALSGWANNPNNPANQRA